MTFTFHPRDVLWYSKSGRGDMSLAEETYFGLSEGWCLVSVRVHFNGGTGTAACSLYILNIDDPEGAYNGKLYNFDDPIGTGTDGHVSVETEGWELLHAFSFRPTQRLLLNWTNPDTGNMQWGVEVGIIPWSKIGANNAQLVTSAGSS